MGVAGRGHVRAAARSLFERLSLRFAWYDLWIGAYWDRERRVLYLCLVPMIALRIDCARWVDVKVTDPPAKSGKL